MIDFVRLSHGGSYRRFPMKKSPEPAIRISVRKQQLVLRAGRKKLAEYAISTSRFGLGSEEGSFKTPLGKFRIAEKIGDGMPLGTVFKSRRPVKATKKALRDEDLVMTRILWLHGLEPGNANTHARYIYIHGTNHEEKIGLPDSHGCVRMKNADLVELFDTVTEGTSVEIKP
jgi:L,D-transpeptidase YbiS